MKKLGSREVRRMMQRMGMELEPVEGVVEVIFKLQNKILMIKSPQVSLIRLAGQSIYQVVGEAVEETAEVVETAEAVEIMEEDVQLVASQAGVSLDEARKALKESKGDLAKAILALKTMKG